MGEITYPCWDTGINQDWDKLRQQKLLACDLLWGVGTFWKHGSIHGAQIILDFNKNKQFYIECINNKILWKLYQIERRRRKAF